MASPFAERPIATIVSSHGAVLSLMATMLVPTLAGVLITCDAMLESMHIYLYVIH